jgi:hypothetical protein
MSRFVLDPLPRRADISRCVQQIDLTAMKTFLSAMLEEASVLPMDAAMQTMIRLTPNDTAIKARRSRMRHCTALSGGELTVSCRSCYTVQVPRL